MLRRERGQERLGRLEREATEKLAGRLAFQFKEQHSAADSGKSGCETGMTVRDASVIWLHPLVISLANATNFPCALPHCRSLKA